MDNISKLAFDLMSSSQTYILVEKLVDILLGFYEQNYKKRKVVMGHVNVVQNVQAQKRGLTINLLLLLIDLADEELNDKIRVKSLEVLLNLEDFYKNASRKLQ